MDLQQAIKVRHSVRSYTGKAIEEEELIQLRQLVEECNKESGLNIQLCLNEPKAFQGLMARYGKFENVTNYIAFVGKKDKDLDEKCGYYGEKIVLRLTQLGLHSCWVGASYSKGKTNISLKPGEKLLLVISFGYGTTVGTEHKVKPVEQLCLVHGSMPEWFQGGIEAAQLAPTAINQQKFCFELVEGNKVKASTGKGFYTKVDLGIAKYHFEVGAAPEKVHWV